MVGGWRGGGGVGGEGSKHKKYPANKIYERQFLQWARGFSKNRLSRYIILRLDSGARAVYLRPKSLLEAVHMSTNACTCQPMHAIKTVKTSINYNAAKTVNQ